jgi:hypothetical protein
MAVEDLVLILRDGGFEDKQWLFEELDEPEEEK